MEFGQLIEYNKKNIFLPKWCRKWVKETSSRPLLFFVFFIQGKCIWSAAWFHCISIALKLEYNKNELYETLDNWSRDMLNFYFLRKDLGIVSPLHFVYNFSTKMFLMLYSINWPDFIVLLCLLFKILCNMCIAIVSFLHYHNKTLH